MPAATAETPETRASLWLATGNRHKVDEIAAMLARLPLHVEAAPKNFAVDEDGTTFAQNAEKKARALQALLAAKQAPLGATRALWVLADDSGLVVPALEGAPGVRSARYAPAAVDQDAANRRQLLQAMSHLPGTQRSAHFTCALACIDPDGVVHTFAGEVHGHIADLEAGRGGFGYDSLFVPAGYDETFAQGPAERKAELSHRARAVAALYPLLARGTRS